MSLLSTAIKNQQWELAAHALVYAAARTLTRGEKPDVRRKPGPEPEKQ